MRVQNNAVRKPTVDEFGDWFIRYVDRRFDDQETLHGPAICSRCHAFLETDHWRYDERQYRAMKEESGVHTTVCPGCQRVERRLYEGEVRVFHQGDAGQKADLVHLIHNEEARARATNVSARVALLEERGDEIYVLTTTQFLAKRIGRELQKAFHGSLKVDNLPYERFTRVRWTQG